MDEPPAFRVNRKRKFTRKRTATSPIDGRKADGDDLSHHDDESVSNDAVGIANIVKLRKSQKSRASGVLFSQQKRNEYNHESPDNMTLTQVTSDEEKLKDISDRFIGSTGQVVDVDKHMMEYIDSEMAKRKVETAQNMPQASSTAMPQMQTKGLLQQAASADYRSQAQLSEVDLGPDAYKKNLARTEAAMTQAQSGFPPPTQEVKHRKPRKPRLGRDGKPLQPRPRKRRNSEDIARDALVEQMLHEHKMDIYEGDPNVAYEEGEHADEKLAEQFRQHFMDAMAERQQKNQVKATNAARAKGMGPDQSGPKLGGSRSARAKMALQQQGQQP